jgi:hypothetical protein
MTSLKHLFNRRIGPRETLAVIAIILVFAGAGYFISQFVAAKILAARVNAAIPQVCGQIRQQRQIIIAAIEAYKTQFGFYPPDHVLSRQPLQVDAVTNTLFYELAGVRYDATNHLFEVNGMEAAEATFVKEFLGHGFTNCAENPNQVKRFLPDGFLPMSQFHDDPDVYALGGRMIYESPHPEVIWEMDFSSWRYVCSATTNNPGKFDLWMELKTKDRTITIGNWKTVQ